MKSKCNTILKALMNSNKLSKNQDGLRQILENNAFYKFLKLVRVELYLKNICHDVLKG